MFTWKFIESSCSLVGCFHQRHPVQPQCIDTCMSVFLIVRPKCTLGALRPPVSHGDADGTDRQTDRPLHYSFRYERCRRNNYSWLPLINTENWKVFYGLHISTGTADGREILWCDKIRYLGIYVKSAGVFRCSYDNAKNHFTEPLMQFLEKWGALPQKM